MLSLRVGQEEAGRLLPGSISAAATTYDAGSARKRGLFPFPHAGSGDKVSFLPLLLLAVIVVLIVIVIMMVVVAVVVGMIVVVMIMVEVVMIMVVVVIMVMLTAGVVRIGVKLLDADRLLRDIGKLGDEIDHLVLE